MLLAVRTLLCVLVYISFRWLLVKINNGYLQIASTIRHIMCLGSYIDLDHTIQACKLFPWYTLLYIHGHALSTCTLTLTDRAIMPQALHTCNDPISIDTVSSPLAPTYLLRGTAWAWHTHLAGRQRAREEFGRLPTRTRACMHAW